MRVTLMWSTVDLRLMAQPTSLFLLPAPPLLAPSSPALPQLPTALPQLPRPMGPSPSPDSASLELWPQSLALASHAHSPILLVVLKFLTPYVCLWVESPANFLEVQVEPTLYF